MTNSEDYFYQRTGRTLDQIRSRKKHFYYCNFFANIFCLATFLGLFTFIIIAVYLYYGGDQTNRILHSLIFIIPCTVTSIWKVYAKLNLKRVTDEEEFTKIIQTQSFEYHNERYRRGLGSTHCSTNFTNGSIHVNQVVYHRRENDQVISNDGLLNNQEHSTKVLHGDVVSKNVPDAQDLHSENRSENNSAKDNTEASDNIYEELPGEQQRVLLANSDVARGASSNRFTEVKLDDSRDVQDANADISQVDHDDKEEEFSIKIIYEKCSRSNDDNTEFVNQEPKQDTSKDNVGPPSWVVLKGVTSDDSVSVKEINTEESHVVNNNKKELDNEHNSKVMDTTKNVLQDTHQETTSDNSDVAGLYSPQRFRRGNVCNSVDIQRTDTGNVPIVPTNNNRDLYQESSFGNNSRVISKDGTKIFIQKPEQEVPAENADASTLRSSKRFKRVRFADNLVQDTHTKTFEVVITKDKVESHNENESENSSRMNNMDSTKNRNRESKRDDSPSNVDVAGLCSPRRFRRDKYAENFVLKEEDAELSEVVLGNYNTESDLETESQTRSRENKMNITKNMNKESKLYSTTDIAGLCSPQRFKKVRFADNLVIQETDTEILDVVNDINEKESDYETGSENSFIIYDMDQELNQDATSVNRHAGLFLPQCFRRAEVPDSVDIQEAVTELFRKIHHNKRGESYQEGMFENISRIGNKPSSEYVYKQTEQDVLANNVDFNAPLKGCRRKVKNTTGVRESDINLSKTILNNYNAESDREVGSKRRSRKHKVETIYINPEPELGFLADESHVGNLGSRKHSRRVNFDDRLGFQEIDGQQVFVNNLASELGHEHRSKKSSRRKHRDKDRDWDQEPNENSAHSCTSKHSRRIRKFRVHDIAEGGCKYFNEEIVYHERRVNDDDSDNNDNMGCNYPSVRYRNGMKEYVFGPLPATGVNDNEDLSDEIWVTTKNPAMDFDYPNVCYSNAEEEYIFKPTPSATAGSKSTRHDIDTQEEALYDRPRSSSRCERKHRDGKFSDGRQCMNCSDIYYDYDNFFSPSLN